MKISLLNVLARLFKTAEKINSKKDFVWKGQKSLYSFVFKRVDSESVFKHLMRLGSTVSKNDVLNMDSKLLRLSAHIIAPFISNFINASLNLGVVLSDLGSNQFIKERVTYLMRTTIDLYL